MSTDYKPIEQKMQKCIEVLSGELAHIRAGRATAAVLDKITVDYYGTPTPVAQIATIAVPEPRILTITPWDATVLRAIEKAILQSDLGLNPTNDGKTIRLVFPPLTEERRKELAKLAKKYGEEAKVALRNVRRDALEKFKAMKKKGEMTEDDLKAAEKEVQNMTDKYTKNVDKVVADKEKEILEV